MVDESDFEKRKREEVNMRAERCSVETNWTAAETKRDKRSMFTQIQQDPALMLPHLIPTHPQGAVLHTALLIHVL